MALANGGADAEPAEQSSHLEIEQHSTKVLMIGALGVVYGDIGTSPIYAFREALVASSRGEVADRFEDVIHRLISFGNRGHLADDGRADHPAMAGHPDALSRKVVGRVHCSASIATGIQVLHHRAALR